jgi:hypothetical protein
VEIRGQGCLGNLVLGVFASGWLSCPGRLIGIDGGFEQAVFESTSTREVQVNFQSRHGHGLATKTCHTRTCSPVSILMASPGNILKHRRCRKPTVAAKTQTPHPLCVSACILVPQTAPSLPQLVTGLLCVAAICHGDLKPTKGRAATRWSFPHPRYTNRGRSWSAKDMVVSVVAERDRPTWTAWTEDPITPGSLPKIANCGPSVRDRPCG